MSDGVYRRFGGWDSRNQAFLVEEMPLLFVLGIEARREREREREMYIRTGRTS